MDSNKQKFKDDIERAERLLLIYSWAGIVAASVLIGVLAWSLA